MEKTTNEHGKEMWVGCTAQSAFKAGMFHKADISEGKVKSCFELHTDLGSLRVSVLSSTGFSWRDTENSYTDKNGKSWIALGGFDVRLSEAKTLGEAIAWVKRNANNCNEEQSMQTIDWGAAPEGATHYLPETTVRDAMWLKVIGTDVYTKFVGRELGRWVYSNASLYGLRHANPVPRSAAKPARDSDDHQPFELNVSDLERIEAHWRESPVNEMMSHIYACLPKELWEEVRPACYALYEAGYRKP